MPGTRFELEVQPFIPEPLARLEELANDLLYSWERQVRRIFYRIDRPTWESSGHNPKVFLRRVSQAKLDAAARDRLLMADYNRALSYYDTYMNASAPPDVTEHLDPETDLVAYFCAEFGLHESLPIYSGGLGILAGDHCKAASDMSLPFVAIGLLYRQGYFTQTIDGLGNQVAEYNSARFADLPALRVLDADGGELQVPVEIEGRTVMLQVWSIKAGHITMYLLDSDVPANSADDRTITRRLYGGGRATRIKQEVVLGIGGVRALRALGLKPTVWHINEGHAAFMALERCREQVEQGYDFEVALTRVAGCTVFTTHTPVPAGHDIFSFAQISETLGAFHDKLRISQEQLLRLGTSGGSVDGFNMTNLALHGSGFRNGVSRIHGGVASRMEQQMWPQVPEDENPVGYVTNGIHVPTFLSREMSALFDMRFGAQWRGEMRNPGYWNVIDDIPDHTYWSVRQLIKSAMIKDLRKRLVRQYRRNGYGEALIERLTRFLDPTKTEPLFIGFARRFATYKRAILILSDRERLLRLMNDPARPVVLVFAGKAHPEDAPGQELMKHIHEFAHQREFEGKILLVEGYDMALARKLVAGVDVWLNTPEYPLEASGTSGQKAGVNGAINLSVLDGWWGEGYNGRNGWAVTAHGQEFDRAYRDQEEGRELLELLEHQVISTYYDRQGLSYSPEWIKRSKESMKSLIPRFNSQRMVMDYIANYYGPAARQHRLLSDDAAPAELTQWRKRVAGSWSEVRVRRVDESRDQLHTGERLPLQVAVSLGELTPDDVVVECLFGTLERGDEFANAHTVTLRASGRLDSGEQLFELDYTPTLPGLQYYKVRIYPHHKFLGHPFETGLMVWL